MSMLRLVGGLFVSGVVLGGKRRAFGRFLGNGCLGFGFMLRVSQAQRVRIIVSSIVSSAIDA